jgi:hypothetical protein
MGKRKAAKPPRSAAPAHDEFGAAAKPLAAVPPVLFVIVVFGVVVVAAAVAGMLGGTANRGESQRFCSPIHGPHAIQEPHKLPPELLEVATSICEYLGQKPAASRFAQDRWTPQVESSLRKHVEAVKDLIAADDGIVMLKEGDRSWVTFHRWVDMIALASNAFELRALSAPVMATIHWETVLMYEQLFRSGLIKFKRVGDLRTAKPRKLTHMATQTVRAYNQAGQPAEAQRFFQELLDYKDPSGSNPYTEYYDSADFMRISSFPMHGLQVLTWPDPHLMLPEGIGTDLLDNFDRIAADAGTVGASGALAEAGDAYPMIAVDSQWSKLVLFTAGNGWNETLCLVLPSICDTLRGTLRSEQEPARTYYRNNRYSASDEAVILFQITAGGMAPLHNGQDRRINVHMCLLNCESSQLVVAGAMRNISAGELYSFEDRADHEIKNGAEVGAAARVSLTIAVLHPDVELDGEDPAPPTSLLRYVIDQNARRYWTY